MEIKNIWVVKGYKDAVDVDVGFGVDPVYTHAFATKAEALEIYRRGTTEAPHIFWEICSMNYGYMEFANYMFDLLKEEETV